MKCTCLGLILERAFQDPIFIVIVIIISLFLRKKIYPTWQCSDHETEVHAIKYKGNYYEISTETPSFCKVKVKLSARQSAILLKKSNKTLK